MWWKGRDPQSLLSHSLAPPSSTAYCWNLDGRANSYCLLWCSFGRSGVWTAFFCLTAVSKVSEDIGPDSHVLSLSGSSCIQLPGLCLDIAGLTPHLWLLMCFWWDQRGGLLLLHSHLHCCFQAQVPFYVWRCPAYYRDGMDKKMMKAHAGEGHHARQCWGLLLHSPLSWLLPRSLSLATDRESTSGYVEKWILDASAGGEPTGRQVTSDLILESHLHYPSL